MLAERLNTHRQPLRILADRDTPERNLRAACDAAQRADGSGHVSIRQTYAEDRAQIELCLEIFQVQREVQDVGVRQLQGG